MATLHYHSYKGAEIAKMFEPLGLLRISVFQDWPYLYAGNLDYEMSYLQTYANSPRSLLFTASDGNSLIGATTCIPLSDETAEVQAPFIKAGMDVSTIFYFGESILLPPYRGHGLGHRFFDERESHARSFGVYQSTCFCGVIRPPDHPSRPSEYRPLDDFWKKRGYQAQPNLMSEFEWLDIGESKPTLKPMMYWARRI